jgi:hypothetical protein
MNYELKRLELAIMNVFMYLLDLIIGKSKVLLISLSSGNVQYLSSNPAIVGEVCDLDIQ